MHAQHQLHTHWCRETPAPREPHVHPPNHTHTHRILSVSCGNIISVVLRRRRVNHSWPFCLRWPFQIETLWTSFFKGEHVNCIHLKKKPEWNEAEPLWRVWSTKCLMLQNVCKCSLIIIVNCYFVGGKKKIRDVGSNLEVCKKASTNAYWGG